MLKKLNWSKFAIIAVSVALLTGAFVAGRASLQEDSYYNGSKSASREDSAAACSYDGAYYAEDGFYEEDIDAEEYELAEEEGGLNYKNTAAGVDVDEEAVENGEKLVYSARIELQSKTYKEHRDVIYSLVDEYGVIIEDMSENSTGSGAYGSFTLRVPYQSFNDVYRRLSSEEEGWTVRNASSSVVNMTRQYSKLTAQIEAYEAERDTLKALLKDAETVSETLEIQDRLAYINADLQYYYGQRNDIDSDVEMSTITVSLQEIKEPVIQEKPTYTFSERASHAFRYGVSKFRAFWEILALFFVRNWLFMVMLAVVGCLGYVYGRIMKRRKLRREAAKAAKPEEETK